VPRRAWIAFATVSVLWGLPYLFIKVAVDEVSPAAVVFARAALGAALLAPLAMRTGALIGLRARWRSILVLAALDMAGPFLLISAGQRHIPSSLAGILVASVPLLVAVLALWVDHSERVRGVRLVGLFVGFAGVVMLLGVEVSASGPALVGALLVLGASLSYAAATLFYKRELTDASPLGVVTVSLSLSAAMLAVPAALTAPAQVPSAGALASLVVLGVFCTALAFWVFYRLVGDVGAGKAAVITYVAPAVSVLAGVLVLGEALTAGAVAGLLLILAGSYLSTGGRLPPRLPALGRRRTPARPPAEPELAAPAP